MLRHLGKCRLGIQIKRHLTFFATASVSSLGGLVQLEILIEMHNHNLDGKHLGRVIRFLIFVRCCYSTLVLHVPDEMNNEMLTLPLENAHNITLGCWNSHHSRLIPDKTFIKLTLFGQRKASTHSEFIEKREQKLISVVLCFNSDEEFLMSLLRDFFGRKSGEREREAKRILSEREKLG